MWHSRFIGKPSNPSQASIALKAMSHPLIPRGPDSSDFWFEPNFSVGFAHRRLSILEVSQLGSQPMGSHSDRYILVINGEIYNHLELRKKIDRTNPTCWRGRSDTETLLAGFDTWGILETLKKTVGMFAFAVWDHREKTLTLARDRLGEKTSLLWLAPKYIHLWFYATKPCQTPLLYKNYQP